MFYVQRNAEGRLVRVQPTEFPGYSETLAADHLDIQAWFSSEAVETSLKALQQSDLDMVRVLDDLIQLLTSKGVIRITDLPPAAQAKLMDRTQAREALGGLSRLINDEETGLI
ncbi:tryptophan synthase subunit beta [Pseudomonas japonica]|uniref:tryptophan synthase subunit beta n=1 Tax=Pseudomonas japonica TaxID=256466 RepID=UPI0015E3AB00|nr:tryptophan synthase subunit beta [Pseudomonas japonica]MBA1287831.1 tryptophan synthase subunit beta [Pseudomonas japonica]